MSPGKRKMKRIARSADAYTLSGDEAEAVHILTVGIFLFPFPFPLLVARSMQCSPPLIARSIWPLPYLASGTLTKLWKGTRRLYHFVSPSAAHLHISLASYRPSPSITVSSDPHPIYIYAYAYPNVNVLALV
ncbi:hypothetical protein B0H13DRAFT_2322149 [Mycena leptocephala]|nr:hypothetical protein B0H13DRAFT_2322149 [Mycena leptocephala]